MNLKNLQSYMQTHKVSQAEVAKKLGVSPATVSQYLKGAYTGDVVAIDKKIDELLARVKDREQAINTDFVATKTAIEILDTCDLAHKAKNINIVIGGAGLGKTRALKYYAQTISNVILIEADPTFSPKVLLIELCNKLSISPTRNNHDNLTAIIDKLNGSERLLVIDEAELLNYKSLEIVRRIHDKAQIGVILAGMPKLKDNLRGSMGELKQLYSRVARAYTLPRVLPDADIEKLIVSAIGTDEFNDIFVQKSEGNARRLDKLLQGVNRLCIVSNKAISQEMVTKVSDMLIN